MIYFYSYILKMFHNKKTFILTATFSIIKNITKIISKIKKIVNRIIKSPLVILNT